MTTKQELNFKIEELEANEAILEDESKQLYDIIETAREKRNELKSINKDNVGVTAVVSIENQLQLLEDIFGKGEDDALQTV